MDSEIFVAGIGISQDVVATIVTVAAEKVEGVASVGDRNLASGLISMFSPQPSRQPRPVVARVTDDKLCVTVHLAVFFGYPFTKIASDVRSAVAAAIDSQMGIEPGCVDVCIDDLVFPKE